MTEPSICISTFHISSSRLSLGSMSSQPLFPLGTCCPIMACNICELKGTHWYLGNIYYPGRRLRNLQEK